MPVAPFKLIFLLPLALAGAALPEFPEDCIFSEDYLAALVVFGPPVPNEYIPDPPL